MKRLELLAPARNLDIGIAAIDCGADAVYIGGPSFGARHAAGNSLEDIASLCLYAHKFGAKVFLTVNTILKENEINEARSLMYKAQEIGIDAFIIQDEVLMNDALLKVPVHASTQCTIRDVETARHFASLGVSRLVLEREMSLKRIREISSNTSCEIEFFVHGALCVCYSGQCYLSEVLSGRSANRGECIQACRSLYDLVDEDGKTLVKNKALLSLKDYNLINRLEDLAEAGVCSFKIEGRLKNASYVKNTVTAYSQALNKIVLNHPDKYFRPSFGKTTSRFEPCLEKSFNRGFTTLFLDGKRNQWSSMNAPKSMGEYLGTVKATEQISPSTMSVSINPVSGGIKLSNGDGFSIVGKDDILGFRGDICKGLTINAKALNGIKKGDEVYRNLNLSFEKELDAKACRREIDLRFNIIISDKSISFEVLSEDGRSASKEATLISADAAKDIAGFIESIRTQFSKKHLHYSASEVNITCPDNVIPRFMTLSALNSMRRELIEILDSEPCHCIPLGKGKANPDGPIGIKVSHEAGNELMRTKYCIRYELGLCLKNKGVERKKLYLLNHGRRFPLAFDCERCEMTVNLK